jgi:DNA-directed RNA polymerase subunit RPC12/RpoP
MSFKALQAEEDFNIIHSNLDTAFKESLMADTENIVEKNADETEIRDTDIIFDCPRCKKNLVIDYRAAGLEIKCSECGESILVPIPDGMLLSDLDLDKGEILKQLFATRRNYQKAEQKVNALRACLTQLQETLAVMQQVTAEGLRD